MSIFLIAYFALLAGLIYMAVAFAYSTASWNRATDHYNRASSAYLGGDKHKGDHESGQGDRCAARAARVWTFGR